MNDRVEKTKQLMVQFALHGWQDISVDVLGTIASLENALTEAQRERDEWKRKAEAAESELARLRALPDRLWAALRGHGRANRWDSLWSRGFYVAMRWARRRLHREIGGAK